MSQDELNTKSDTELADEEAAFGRMLKFWRSQMGLSQAQLSARLGTSSRHISFLETGRSRPSRGMVQRLQQEFDLSSRESNLLLQSAGFLPISTANPSGMGKRLKRQMSWMLLKHEPYPSFIVNNLGDVLMFNRAWLSLMRQAGMRAGVACEAGLQMNMYHLFFSEEGMRHLIEGWEDFSCALLLQVKEQQLLTNDAKLNELMEWLEAYPGIPDNWPERARQVRFDSSYDIEVKLPESRYRMKTVVTGIEPMNLSAGGTLKLHSYFPGDDATEAWWRSAAEKDSYENLQHPLLALATV
ncbi:helix-turn-helix domain-containing protein [Pseudoteredinibacter isoporae]|uniref:Transcriptional regulator with XRE-family HTH domain n=1 Tax=Pseudoteredinibacter isoporae TaxID=570281 RepID=A0A7X0JPL0_9GAMM|nr:helix-turn-helix domain-containing protein [Pseudoteredinibacter isoporae]MBB6519935.1 transcriptional regulator with XRE-family HTH domain [Pseudoteredinibacter isoporae]NHO85510.1 helix-turn-helix transcriptional regulator [Pseudoteredinibacter isoporae]NIB26038.1 helix-turn-helix transcriptional regulator [Pseudoteredinibacter isoporae]